MTFRRVNNFTTEDPKRLARELSTMEDNLTAEFNLLRAELAPNLRAVSFVATPARGIVAILPDQQLSVDTSLANASVVFPALDPRNFGHRFAVVKRVTAGSIVTSCQDAAVLCNAAPFPTIVAAGLTIFCCDSSGYFSK